MVRLLSQVCAHIVDGIHKETLRLREEWESCSGQASFGDVRYVIHNLGMWNITL